MKKAADIQEEIMTKGLQVDSIPKETNHKQSGMPDSGNIAMMYEVEGQI